MTLSQPDSREHLHTRTIESSGFKRSDGMWDIEATLKDTKPYEVPNEWRGPLEPGNPIHHMQVRLTIDDDFVVQKVEVSMVDTPFKICGEVGPAFQGLVGVSISSGWNKAVQRTAGGVSGCTHIIELMRIIGTVAYQTLYPLVRMEKESSEQSSRPSIIGTCRAFAADSPVTKRIYPDWYEESQKIL
tara:strand:+ start:1917 stop:2477 length:561 start_codon:yes stop_codon:yes gene_type:complete